MINESKSIEKIASENLYKALGKKVTVHSWVMSENTDENPNWHEKDEELSLKMVEVFVYLASMMGIENVRFAITDRGGNEIEPHYAIDIQIGSGNLEKEKLEELCIQYLAKVDNEKHLGDIVSSVKFDGTANEHDIFVRFLFEKYWTLLEQYYPDFYSSYFEKINQEDYVPYDESAFKPSKRIYKK